MQARPIHIQGFDLHKGLGERGTQGHNLSSLMSSFESFDQSIQATGPLCPWQVPIHSYSESTSYRSMKPSSFPTARNLPFELYLHSVMPFFLSFRSCRETAQFNKGRHRGLCVCTARFNA